MSHVIIVLNKEGQRVGFFNAARTKCNAQASFLTPDIRRAKRLSRDQANIMASRYNAMNAHTERTAYAVSLEEETENA